MSKALSSLRGALIPALLLALWEGGARAGLLPPSTMSSPVAIFAAGWEALQDGSLLWGTFETFEAALGGLAIGTLIGTAVGAPLGLSPMLEAIVGPTLDTIRPVPSMALLPLALLIYGFGLRMEILVVAFACTWPVLIVTIGAVRAIDSRLLDVARALEMRRHLSLRTVILPAALARIGVGIRVAAGIAIVVAVTTEIVLNPRGLGYGMIVAAQSMRPDLMWAELIWLGLVGFLFDFLLRWIERRWLSRYAPVALTS
jgi:ABC-type nitrate/sulfonate/bicarbonate transport system permease component